MKSRKYEQTIGFDLWITHRHKSKTIRRTLVKKMELPISKKFYVVTLKNVKTYIHELQQSDASIIKVQIYRITFVGTYNFDTANDKEE